MMFSLHDYVMWALNIGLNLALVCLTWDKSRFAQWPFFRLFLQASLLKSVLLVVVSRMGNNTLYFYSYWALGTVLLPFLLGIVFEVFSDLFRPFRTIPRTPLNILISCLVAVEIAAFAMAILYPGVYTDSLMMICHAFERAITIIIVFALALTFLFTRYFRMPWRPRTTGIAIGLFEFAVLRLLVMTFQSGAPRPILFVLRSVSMFSYLIAQLLWAVAIWRTRTHRSPLAKSEVKQLQHDTRNLREAMSGPLESLEIMGKSHQGLNSDYF